MRKLTKLWLILVKTSLRLYANDNVSAGRSVGMATLLRGIPFHVRNREIYLPVYEMAQVGPVYLLDSEFSNLVL